MNYITGKTSFGVMAPSAVSLGKFDGLHRGHQKLLQHILEQKKNGLEATIFTFASNPTRMMSGLSAQNILTNEERREMLAKAGVDNLLSALCAVIAHMEPERFIEEVLVGQLKMKFAAVGNRFSFWISAARRSCNASEAGTQIWIHRGSGREGTKPRPGGISSTIYPGRPS